MAIDRIKKLTILCPVNATQRLMKTLHGLGVVEITDVFDQYDDARDRLQRQDVCTEDCDRELQKINLMLGLIDIFAPEVQGFIAGLAPTPMVVTPRELDEALQHFPLDAHYQTAQELDMAYRKAERTISDIETRIAELKPLEDLPFRVGDLTKPTRVRLQFGQIQAKHLEALSKDQTAAKVLAWGTVIEGKYHRKDGSAGTPPPVSKPNAPVRVVFACITEDEEAARKILGAYGFEEIALPPLTGTVRDHIRELEGDLVELRAQVAEIEKKVKRLAVHRRALLMLKAFWDSCRNLALARANSAHGRWVQVVSGYIREKDLPALHAVIDKEFPNVSVITTDPAPGEDVPVSLSLPPLVRPVQLLVSMYGLPKYEAFDPSPALWFSFFLFFGICFGDVAYGTMLILLGYYIMRRTRVYEGVYNFAKLLFMAGFPTVFFGLILGSCFGDLYKPQYLGEGNPLYRLISFTQMLDPMDQPVIMLLAALAIGVLNQFWALGLRMYGMVQQGDKMGVVYDGILWLITLPGFIILVSKMFVSPPPVVMNVGLALFGVGALGLVLTQGRENKNPIARLMAGLVSLYGIVGSYGITSFIGDTMSYCRLLALGLTTSIVAMSFNMMADLLRPVPYVGTLLFVGALVVGHGFNFFISVMGAFVHSMRLIMVEFFGRFYEGGSRPFRPLGFDSETAILRKVEQ
mgnify:CR=1 FL=1